MPTEFYLAASTVGELDPPAHELLPAPVGDRHPEAP